MNECNVHGKKDQGLPLELSNEKRITSVNAHNCWLDEEFYCCCRSYCCRWDVDRFERDDRCSSLTNRNRGPCRPQLIRSPGGVSSMSSEIASRDSMKYRNCLALRAFPIRDQLEVKSHSPACPRRVSSVSH